MLFGEGDGFVDVDEAQRGVGGRFDVKSFCAGRHELFDAGEIGADLADGNAHVGKNIAQEAIGAAVELGSGNDFVAAFYSGEKRGRDGSHAGRSDDGGFGAFERGDFFLGDAQSGIAVTGVNVGLVFSLGPELHFFGGRKREGGRADDFCDDGAVDAVTLGFAAMDGLGLRAEICVPASFHGKSVRLVGEEKQGPNWRVR